MRAIHIVSAWAGEHRAVLAGQMKVEQSQRKNYGHSALLDGNCRVHHLIDAMGKKKSPAKIGEGEPWWHSKAIRQTPPWSKLNSGLKAGP